jgi:hypothetical protein
MYGNLKVWCMYKVLPLSRFNSVFTLSIGFGLDSILSRLVPCHHFPNCNFVAIHPFIISVPFGVRSKITKFDIVNAIYYF